MKLHIYSLRSSVIEKAATSVSVQTPLGEITVLDNHIPFITPIEKGKVRIVEKNGKEDTFKVEGGFIEVRPGSEVNLLANLD